MHFSKKSVRNGGIAAVLACATAFAAGGAFIRGDATNDGIVDVRDAAGIAGYVVGRPGQWCYFAPPCREAADVNGDGIVDLCDVQALMRFLTRKGPQPCDPFPARGLDRTPKPAAGCRPSAADRDG